MAASVGFEIEPLGLPGGHRSLVMSDVLLEQSC